MFQKVIIAEDMDDIHKGVYDTLDELGISEIHQEQYCDNAYLKIKKAAIDQEPYDLLITDLSFKTDYRVQKYVSGDELIAKLREDFTDLKIIAYSVEEGLPRVRRLVDKHGVNAYVCKGRTGLKDLTTAIRQVFENETYLSQQVIRALDPQEDLEISDHDLLILNHLAAGLTQPEISVLFKKEGKHPYSLSSIEKHLNKLKIQFDAQNVLNLVVIVKDLGLI